MDGPNVVAFRSLSNAIRDLIAPVFGNDMLTIERVTWSSPGYLLQNISEGEAVHPVRSWSDLKKRLGPYRRCFILSHPAVPQRPLAILHVALMGNITSSLSTILSRTTNLSLDSESDIEPRPPSDYEDTQLVTTAIFYSISSTQKGLTVGTRNLIPINFILIIYFRFPLGYRLRPVFDHAGRSCSTDGDPFH